MRILYSITIVLSAFLLFLVQPIISKYILPWFGGSAAVWTTCIVFFQTFLLFGYAYSHLITRYLRPRQQIILHVLILLLALVLLPIIPGDQWKPTSNVDPTIRILTLLFVSLGIPYFVLATTGPLLQRWLSMLSPATVPYRLYALSNVGSLLALIAYPFVVEPNIARRAQAEVWSWGMMVFVVVCVASAVYLWRKASVLPGPRTPDDEKQEVVAVPLLDRALWITLPAIASVLLLSTTNKLCQEVVPMPLLWVLPLAIYLLTFVLTFDHPRWYSRPTYAIAYLVAISIVCWMMFNEETLTFLPQLAIYSCLVFIGCMICHGEVARLKPPPSHLTSYYLSIAAGGAMGGMFVTFLAPVLFSGYYEFQCAILACCGVVLLMFFVDETSPLRRGKPRWAWAGLAAGVAIFAILFYQQTRIIYHNTVDTARNFFSTLAITSYNENDRDRQFLVMRHGKTLHGYQFINPQYHRMPTSYFTAKGGAGRVLTSLPGDSAHRVGVVGLGVGTLAAYGRPGDYFRFYEINPQVQQLAEKHFTYLADCLARNDIVIGDARLSMEKEPPQNFDVLVLDAFNSDSPPVHLLTREAFEIFLKHIKPDGAILVNISSKQVNLHAVVAAVAKELKLPMIVLTDFNQERDIRRFPSEWIVLTLNTTLLQQRAVQEAVFPDRQTTITVPVWTDDYTSLFPVLNW
ncbi:MAG: fused MFS/spermidine synthase [Ignavibacteria bacterium]|nr:fused MFS/spermidine synthase [Ignavibacteria bacterium]